MPPENDSPEASVPEISESDWSGVAPEVEMTAPAGPPVEEEPLPPLLAELEAEREARRLTEKALDRTLAEMDCLRVEVSRLASSGGESLKAAVRAYLVAVDSYVGASGTQAVAAFHSMRLARRNLVAVLR